MSRVLRVLRYHAYHFERFGVKLELWSEGETSYEDILEGELSQDIVERIRLAYNPDDEGMLRDKTGRAIAQWFDRG